MPQSSVTPWLQFAIQQMAAESYLDGFVFSNTNELIRRLQFGNNNQPILGIDPNPDLSPNLQGATRFAQVQAVEFSQRYQIVNHHASDATGFSATLMKDTTTNTYTLSFRSLEYQNQVDGGDWERDGFPGAAGEIAGTGFALAQLVSMERYYRELKADPNKLPAGAILNVTGYSLGGHLATIFTQLHANDIAATYTFDGAGRGGINGGSSGLSETERIQEMLQFAEAQILNWDPTGDVFRGGNGGNIYSEQWYEGIRGQTVFEFRPTSSFLPPGQIGSAPGFEKITQLVGQATHNDQPYVANSGIHATPTTIFIEDQPNVDGLGGLFGQSGSFGTTHSITLLVDSLALMELFQQVDGTLDQTTIEGIFAAASSQTGSGVVGLAGLAEGNSLENALDALGKILVPNYIPTPFGRQTNDFGNLTFRNPFYANLEAVRAQVDTQTYQIVGFATKSSSEIYAAARNADATGLAYRYALQALNPFAVVGADYTRHNPAGQDGGPVDLYDAQTGHGTWTALALSDRAELLAKRLAYNLSDGGAVPTDTHYVDVQTGFEVGSTSSTNEVIFGDDRVGDVIIGHSGDDHLYGRDGADTIEGNGGRDYIEGGVGNDPRLSGGAGDDIILGQQGDDQLYGEADNDRLNGGLGNDLLDGGTGRDTYFYRTGQGLDRIIDADKIGTIIFDNQTLVGGIRRQGTPANTYLSPNGQFTFVKSGTNLIINTTLTIENFDFQTGALGIKLSDAGNLVDSAGPVINYANGQPTITYDGDATDNTPFFTAAANHEAYGFGGNDVLSFEGGSAAFNHQFFGGDGHDELRGGAGQDRLFGEAGRDLMVGLEGDDVLDGGGDIDLLKGGLGQDVLSGGLGNDGLDGGSDDDVLFGGDGNDVLSGESVQLGATTTGDDYLDGEAGDDWLLGLRGDDVLYGGTGADHLYGDQVTAVAPNFILTYPGIVTTVPGVTFASLTGGDDYLDGGAGNDYLQGDAGGDILLGGADQDILIGDDLQVGVIQEGADWLEGEGGNDTLVGGGGEDALFGGDGNDVLVGDYANNAVLGFDDTLDGGAGADELQGGGGADLLLGGSENDLLFGEAGDDVLDGGQGADELQGGNGADLLDGSTENDRLFGQAGDDDLAGGTGDDLLAGGDGHDFLDGEAGIDRLEGGAGQDILVGGTGNDTLLGEADDDTLFGDEGDDVLNGGAGNNLLIGGDGNDQLFGGSGVDQLEGGAGNDVLSGGGGADTYVFNRGDGEDTILDTSGEGNRLVFGAGISNSDVGLGLGSLLIRVGLNGDLIRLPNYNPANPTQSAGIDLFEFADGMTLTHAQLVARGFDLVGTNGNDVLDGGETYQKVFGLGGHDLLIGGTGDNILFGGSGNDQLLGNSGNDQLFGEDGNDTLQGGEGQDLLLGGEGQDIVAGAGEADQLEGGIGDDWLDGGDGNDLLIGGAGTDRLEGRAGYDTYQFNRGDGQDQLWDSATPGEGNALAFGTGIGLGDLQLDLTRVSSDVTPSDLVLRVGSSGDAITFATFGTFDRQDVGGAHSVDQFRFADGTSLTYAQLIARGFDLFGTANGETIVGTNVTDRIMAGAGDDRLRAGRGDDVLDGGAGADRLEGGQGNDTYVFGPGAGQDTLLDIQGTADVVRLAVGVLPSDVVVTQTDRDIVLSLNGGADRLNLSLFRLAPLFRIEQVQFADGTVWDSAFLEDLAAHPIRGTEQADVLQGTAGEDLLVGFGGNDQIIGLAGNDTLDGGTGADFLIGGLGDDAYVVDQSGDVVTESANEGTDTVQTTVSYQLSANVEHLTLTGASAIHGTGNVLDNVLTGNRAANVLTGGLGDDTYVVGAGDTVIELAGEGTDTVLTAVSYQLSSNVENVTIVGSRSLAGTGNALDNVLSAPGSMSTLAGGLGDDIYLVGPGDDVDVVVESANGGSDTVRVARSYRLPDHVERLELLDAPSFHASNYATADPSTVYAGLIRVTDVRVNLFGFPIPVNGIGNALDNVLIGNRGNNVLDGGAGRDTYVLRRGMGHDEVHDYSRSGEIDRVDVAADLAPSQVNILRHQGDLVLHVTGTNDSLRVSSFFLSPDAAMKEVRFADETVWDRTLLEASAVSVAAIPTGVTDDTEYVVRIAGTVVTEALGRGIDTVHAFIDYTLPDYVENLTLADELGGAVASPRIATGNDLDNLLIGNMSDNVLYGGAGNDILVGGFFRSTENQTLGDVGSDILIGGEGDDMLIPVVPYAEFPTDTGGQDRFESSPNTPDDVLVGGRGHDTYVLTHADQTVVERPGEGIDTVRSMVDYTLGTEVENLTLIDNPLPFLPFAQQGTGNELDNVMIGNLAGNVLRGESGDDTLWGGVSTTGDEEEELPENAGNDQLIGGAGNDMYVFNVGDGLDTIDDTVTVGEGNRIQFGVGIAQSDLTFTYNDIARTLTIQVGNSGTDQLRLIHFDPVGTNGSLVVETLTFADGSTANLADLLGLSVNHAPTLAIPLTDQTVPEDASFSIQVPANTFADEDAGDVLTLSASLADGSALPAWLVFDAASRTFSGTPDDAQVGTLNLKVTATDQENLSVSDVFILNIANVNEAPTVVSPLADQQATEDLPFSFVVPTGIFADVDTGDQLTYSATLANGSTLPSWLSFNGATLTFSGTPLNNDVGTLNVAVTAIDLDGLSATDTFALTIQNVNDAPTVANPLADQTVLEDAPFSIQVPGNNFADQDAGDVLSYSATLANGSALPTWLSFNATTRTFTGTPDDAQVGSLDLRVTATDSGNLSVSDVLTLTVANVNEAPTVVAPLADQQAAQGTVFSLMVPTTTFTDVDPGDVLIYSVTLANGASLPLWLSFNPVTRTFSGTPQAGDVGMIDVRVTATDQGSLNAADVFALTIAPSGGTAGNDTLIGTSGNDVLDGLAGDDVLRGLAGNDTLLGGGGNDLLDGGLGTDSMTGGTGSDTYVVSTGDTVVEAANAGTDTVLSNVSYTLAANVELLVLTGTNAINGTGNSLANGITGNAAANVLDGGASADVLAGLDGNDTYLVDNAGDLVVELANNGIDTVQSSVTFTLGANVENLALTGTAAINGTGNGSANVMIGNNGANMFSGAGGADTLRGGLGNDTLNGGSGNDTFVFGRGDGQDLVQDNSGTADKLLYDAGINPLDLVISRQANNLCLSIHGSADHVMIQNWYASSANRTETIQAGNSQTLLSTQVDQLIQAMAGFTAQTGLTWDQAIDQRPQDVQTVLAASWQ